MTTFEETLAAHFASRTWCGRELNDEQVREIALSLVAHGVVADPAEVERLRVEIEANENADIEASLAGDTPWDEVRRLRAEVQHLSQVVTAVRGLEPFERTDVVDDEFVRPAITFLEDDFNAALSAANAPSELPTTPKLEVRHARALAAKDREIARLWKLVTETEALAARDRPTP